MKTEKELLEQIEHVRQSMSRAAFEHGLTSPESIQISQKLDKLMNIYETIRKRENNKPAKEKHQ